MKHVTMLWRACTALLLVTLIIGSAMLGNAAAPVVPASEGTPVARFPIPVGVETPTQPVAATAATATPVHVAQVTLPTPTTVEDEQVILRSTDENNATVLASLDATITSTMALTATDEPPLMTPAEIAAAEAAMRDGQGRMSKARTQFRLAVIAMAEKELKTATTDLEKVRAATITQDDVATAEAELKTAQTDFDRVRLENVSLLDTSAAEANVRAAEAQLQAAQSQTDADPTALALAQERLQAAQGQYTVIVNDAAARVAQAEQDFTTAAANLQQAQDTLTRSMLNNQLAQQGIDPVSGKRFEDAGLDPDAQKQHFALQLAAAQANLDDAQNKQNGAAANIEAAKQQQTTDIAAAQAAVDQAQFELSQVPQGANPTRIAEAQQQLDNARDQLAQIQQSAPLVTQAQQRVQEAQAKLDASRAAWSEAEPLIAEAQKRVDEAQAALKQARQNAVGKGGWTWPTYGALSSGFGKRNLKANSYHNGIDIANEKNTPIGAARAGVITEAGWCKGYGFCVKIDHGGGFSSEYGHMASMPLVNAGDHIEAGTIVGLMGTTYDEEHGGYSTGVHLHLTIRRNGVAIDPLLYLP